MSAEVAAAPVADQVSAPPTDEEALRGRVYGVLGSLLAAPPGLDTLATLAAVVGGDEGDDLERAWDGLGHAARQATPADLAQEYQDLFIGIGRGELVPYASFYLTGYLMERPLAELRDDLKALGLARSEGNAEPEDHAAALCDVMALLCGAHGPEYAVGIEGQREFFGRHLAPWMGRLFADLRQAQSARFYRAVGDLGASFMDLEQRYLSMSV